MRNIWTDMRARDSVFVPSFIIVLEVEKKTERSRLMTLMPGGSSRNIKKVQQRQRPPTETLETTETGPVTATITAHPRMNNDRLWKLRLKQLPQQEYLGICKTDRLVG